MFTRTGVNHLISISGLHITMLSGLAFGLVLAIWRRIPRLTAHLAAVKAAAIAGLFVACGYALLAGFAVPAQRTVYMLAAVAVGLLLGLTSAPLYVLALALFVAVAADPMCVLAPGFGCPSARLPDHVRDARRLGEPSGLRTGRACSGL